MHRNSVGTPLNATQLFTIHKLYPTTLARVMSKICVTRSSDPKPPSATAVSADSLAPTPRSTVQYRLLVGGCKRHKHTRKPTTSTTTTQRASFAPEPPQHPSKARTSHHVTCYIDVVVENDPNDRADDRRRRRCRKRQGCMKWHCDAGTYLTICRYAVYT